MQLIVEFLAVFPLLTAAHALGSSRGFATVHPGANSTSSARYHNTTTTRESSSADDLCFGGGLFCPQKSSCWDLWDDYYQGEVPTIRCETSKRVLQTWTETIWDSTLAADFTAVYSGGTFTRTFYAPGHTIPVFTATFIRSGGTFTDLEPAGNPKSTVTTTTNAYQCYTVPAIYIVTPECNLIPETARCESIWTQWISTHKASDGWWSGHPWCSWGSMDAQHCDKARNLVFGQETYGAQSLSYGHVPREYGLGCTISCGAGCSLTGDRVRLLYWPPKTISPEDQQYGASSEVVAYVDGTTLTSPTIYVSYRTLYAADLCTPFGPNKYRNTIIPLASGQLSSLVYQSLEYSYSGNFINVDSTTLQWKYLTSSFDLNDLVEPIPQSIYDKLPACQASLRMASYYHDPILPCPTNIPYMPLIAIPAELSSMEPAWATCTPWYGGLYDPPSALSAATILSTVTTPHGNYITSTQTPASPSSLIAWLPTQTAPLQTPAFRSPEPLQETATFNAGGIAFTAVRSGPSATDLSIIVKQTTAELHSEPENISGLIFSLQPSAAGIVVGTQTISFATKTRKMQGSAQTHDTYTVLVPQTSRLTPNIGQTTSNFLGSPYIIDSQTLIPGGSAVVIDGTTYSLGPDGKELFINGRETTINQGTSEASDSFEAPSLQDIATTTEILSPLETVGPVENHNPKHKGAAPAVQLQCATIGLAIILGLVAVL